MASLAWLYARTFFSEPLAGLLLILAVERAYSAYAHCDRRALLIAGIATGLLVATIGYIETQVLMNVVDQSVADRLTPLQAALARTERVTNRARDD